jgi:hypothetical protein
MANYQFCTFWATSSLELTKAMFALSRAQENGIALHYPDPGVQVIRAGTMASVFSLHRNCLRRGSSIR